MKSKSADGFRKVITYLCHFQSFWCATWGVDVGGVDAGGVGAKMVRVGAAVAELWNIVSKVGILSLWI